MDEEVTNPQQSASGKIALKTKVILFVTVAVLVVCVLIAVLFNNPKGSAKVENNNTQAVNLDTLEKATAANPTSENVIKLTATYINSNVPGRAFPYLKALIKKEPNNALAYNNLGVANIMLKNYMQGIEACTKAIQLDTSFQLAKNNLKWGIDERNKVLNAIDQLNKSTPDKKDNAYYTQLGFDYFQVGDYDKSISTWQDGLQKFPSADAVYYNNIGSALVLKKQYDAAITDFNKVLATDPNNQLAKNNIDWAKSEAAEKNQ
jgi:tetratricopeptide (TPR) repeat protein